MKFFLLIFSTIQKIIILILFIPYGTEDLTQLDRATMSLQLNRKREEKSESVVKYFFSSRLHELHSVCAIERKDLVMHDTVCGE